MLELLIVLSAWTILLTLVIKLPLNILSLQEEKEFLNTLEVDVLYAQSIAMGASDKNIRILFYKDNYQIVIGNKVTPVRMRNIPLGFSVNMNVMKKVSFDEHGRIREPGNFLITTPNTTYRVVFPFGKGRCYFVEI